MRIFQLTLLCLVCFAKTYGQKGGVVIEITKAKHEVYTVKVVQLDIPPADSAWGRVFEQDLNRFTPVKNHLKKGKYIVSADFIRDKDGALIDVKCDSDPGLGIRAEIVRALKKSRNWSGSVKVRHS